MTWKDGLIYLGYLALFFCSISVLLWQHQQRRKHRLPFADNQKLLRGPGETQLRLVRQFDEDGFMWMILAAIIPATIALGLLLLTAQLPPELQVAGAAVSLGAFALAFHFASRWFTAKAQESGNRYLGYFGERIVAEHLEPIKSQGWRIFHDIPASVRGEDFNIDHIAVCPAGIFVLETKTRRKGVARPGFYPRTGRTESAALTRAAGTVPERKAEIPGSRDIQDRAESQIELVGPFRYPGVRSDSDMFTLGYGFKPWLGAKSIADGTSIRDYVKETASEYGIDRHIRYRRKIVGAAWDSSAARWTVDVVRGEDGAGEQVS
ncbi:MAG: NERD domain-containing protein, partial [Opitutae bacterium]